MPDSGPILELAGVTKSYVSPEGAETPVLRGVDLTLAAGESLAVSGPSGCGKSTLLNIIGTLDRPDAGRVALSGRDVSALSETQLAEVRSTVIGFVFQFHHLLPQCSILENVLVPTLVAKGADDVEGRARKLLDRVGLGARLSHRPGQLSGGECQRAAVVRALINRPRLLLADEPTGSLDRASAEALAQLLGELNQEEGVALITVTHAADLAARAGRVVQMRDGRLGPAAT
ncbi:MAG TPA: ABC transporter ATP-binding protein [Planctomycetota bacterium]|nr:ABC transporter ATP-binding protein [Planctomycetota bacterium]